LARKQEKGLPANKKDGVFDLSGGRAEEEWGADIATKNKEKKIEGSARNLTEKTKEKKRKRKEKKGKKKSYDQRNQRKESCCT